MHLRFCLYYVCVYLIVVYKRLCFMSFNTRGRLKVLIVVLSAVVGVKGDQVVWALQMLCCVKRKHCAPSLTTGNSVKTQRTSHFFFHTIYNVIQDDFIYQSLMPSRRNANVCTHSRQQWNQHQAESVFIGCGDGFHIWKWKPRARHLL